MKNLLITLVVILIPYFAKAEAKQEVILYNSNTNVIYETAVLNDGGPKVTKSSKALDRNPKSLEPGIFEKTLKEAIQTLENSMRKTCTREMETNISITGEGKWGVVGVAITGAMKLNILNPEMLKNCSK